MNAEFDAHIGREQSVSDAVPVQLPPSTLENLIECWRTVGTFETNRDLKRIAFDRMRKLIAQRSPDTVARMEQEQGLR